MELAIIIILYASGYGIFMYLAFRLARYLFPCIPLETDDESVSDTHLTSDTRNNRVK
jgi:hypothetical protein